MSDRARTLAGVEHAHQYVPPRRLGPPADGLAALIDDWRVDHAVRQWVQQFGREELLRKLRAVLRDCDAADPGAA
jgi:hypothetical protein